MVQPKRKDITHHNHYIPQRYQLGFTKGEKVWVYDRQTDSYRHGHPKTVGVLNDFYTTQGPGGGPTDEVEKVLAMVEGTVWPIIDRLDARKREWGKEERANLALFVAFMRTRVPAFDVEQNHFAEDFFRWWAKARNPTPEAISDSIAEATGEAIDLNKAVEMHQMIHNDEYDFENPRQNNIKMMLELALDLAGAFVKMDWTVLWSPKKTAFVTSDNPFVLIPPPDFDFSVSGVGVLTPGATTVIPLSARTLLCLGNDELRSGVRYGYAQRDFVRFTNLCVAANSDRFIMARDEAHLRSLFKKTKAGDWRNGFKIGFSAPNSPV